jgi:hypothetical protein
MALQVGDAHRPLLLLEKRIKKVVERDRELWYSKRIDYAPSHWMQGGRQENK